MTETYNFSLTITISGSIWGAYSKAYAKSSLEGLVVSSVNTFEDSLFGRLNHKLVTWSLWLEETIPSVPKAPPKEQVILPDNRMWMP